MRTCFGTTGVESSFFLIGGAPAILKTLLLSRATAVQYCNGDTQVKLGTFFRSVLSMNTGVQHCRPWFGESWWSSG